MAKKDLILGSGQLFICPVDDLDAMPSNAELETEENKIGSILRDLREGYGLTREQVSERTEIGLRHLAAIELGEKNPSSITLLRLIRSMGAPSDRVVYPELFTSDSDMDRISRLAATCSPKQRRLIVAFIEMLLSQEYSD